MVAGQGNSNDEKEPHSNMSTLTKILTLMIAFVLNFFALHAQRDPILNNKDVDTILQLYYSQIFIDSTQQCKSKYRLLPYEINIEFWNSIDSTGIATNKFSYSPENFYSTLKFEKKVCDESEKKRIESFLGKSFQINKPTDLTTDLSIHPTDSTALKYEGIISELDIKYVVKFNKEHGMIFNIRPEWVFESDFTTSLIIFEQDNNAASVRINLANWKRLGWAYFLKENGKWKLNKVEILDILV